jgi:MYXO-CTERM domain-containing protein
VNYNRSRTPSTTPASQYNNLRFELFSLASTSTFAFAESGNDILGTGTSLGSFDVNASTTPGASVSFSQMIDVSAVAADARIFLRISNLNTQNPGQSAFVDNLSIVSVPEPSAALLGGLGMLALLRRRR